MTHRILHHLFSPSFLVIHSTLAFGLGIILARPDFSFHPALHSATFTLGVACLLSFCLAKRLSHFILITFLVLIGVCHGSFALAPPRAENHIANLISDQREVALVGVIDTAIEYGIERTSLLVAGREIFIPAADNLPALSNGSAFPAFQKTTGLVKLSMRGKPAAILLPGDLILVRAKIGPPQGFNNPGSFDLPGFLADQGILINGWISSPQSLTRLEVKPPKKNFILYGPERLRSHLISFLSLHLPAKYSALYRALITGDRGGLPPDLVELFRSLGIVHLLAISGLHMALLAGAVMALAFFLLQKSERITLNGSTEKIAACAAIVPLILYCLVAGFQTPALRALLMILIFISALLSNRQWHGPTNISLAALLILIINPLAINTVSFQLSFAAVTGIIIILPRARHFFLPVEEPGLKSKILHYSVGSFMVSMAASLATLPFLLYYFNRFALSGALATLIIEPFLCMWALGWGLVATILIPLSTDLALLLFKTGGAGLDIALFLAEKIQPLSTSIWLPTPSPLQIIIFYGGLFLFITSRGFWPRSAAALCCLALFYNTPPELSNDQATILDVGQGNCTLIETINNKVIVVDAGGPHSPSFDIGRQVIGPALWANGIKSIDLLVLSHPDQDHYSGATFLLEHFTPETLWIPTRKARDSGWRKVLSMADKQGTKIHIPQAQEIYPLGNNSELSCLADLHQIKQEKQNNQSLVVRFTSAGHSLLMPGDIETEAENYLVAKQINVASDMIIAPHHGSASSSSRPFLNQVSAQTVIFSASRFKKPYFPNQEVENRYRKIGATSLNTAETGAITIFFRPNGLKTTF